MSSESSDDRELRMIALTVPERGLKISKINKGRSRTKTRRDALWKLEGDGLLNGSGPVRVRVCPAIS